MRQPPEQAGKEAARTLLAILIVSLFVGYTEAQPTYRYDNPPLEPWALEWLDRQLFYEVGAIRDPDGDCVVVWGILDGVLGLQESNPCRITLHHPTSTAADLIHVRDVLVHEFVHVWGVLHSQNPDSLMYVDYTYGQSLLVSDRFALWLRGWRPVPATLPDPGTPVPDDNKEPMARGRRREELN